MADPFRLRVLKALSAALEGITVANGYTHDMSGKVFRGRDLFGPSDPIPMLSILEAVEQDAAYNASMPAAGGLSKYPWSLQIQGFVEDDEDNPTDPAHALLAEVKKRLVEERIRDRGYNILGMDGRVADLLISPGVVRPADELSDKAYFWLRVSLTVVENLQDPYA